MTFFTNDTRAAVKDGLQLYQDSGFKHKTFQLQDRDGQMKPDSSSIEWKQPSHKDTIEMLSDSKVSVSYETVVHFLSRSKTSPNVISTSNRMEQTIIIII